ncbi:phage tail assembly chaperone [Novosphingobium humi]|uniref:Phage tail assembly chaperone n=1 Tax=Novosphingobium humi TaxID=2282397 RepID=A0ABY7U090_9SPHN|nr:phage tail assembly chaperone [Novosphingobium humi]WCT78913.1 phage tail assembly chaperone [Novosphingobium humi]WJT00228.1 phage tail assembly chaperone [Novosphingobium humi]
MSGLAARLLGWRPHEFWAATPAELAAILAPDTAPGAAPLTREEMNRLMERDHG